MHLLDGLPRKGTRLQFHSSPPVSFKRPDSVRGPSMRREAELWWRQGQRDRQTAGNCDGAGDYYAAVFFCHQALEKALKAVIIERRRELPPRTHNLLGLAELAEVPEANLNFLRELTPDYVTTRYPDAAGGPIADLYDTETSQRVLSRTDEVMRWARKQLER